MTNFSKLARLVCFVFAPILSAFVLLVLSPLSAFALGNPAGPAATCPVEPERVLLEEGGLVRAPVGFDSLAIYNTANGKPLKDLSTRLKNSTWLIKNEDLKFASTPYADMEKIMLAWTVAGKTEKSPLCLQSILVPVISAVENVTTSVCDAARSICFAGIGDQILIEVQDLDQWIKNHRTTQGRPTPQSVADLVPFLDGRAVLGIHPENPSTQPQELTSDFHSYQTLRFTLERNASNRAVWNYFLRGLKWNGSVVGLSVGFEGGDPMPSFIQKDRPPATDPYYPYYKTFALTVLPHSSTILAAVLFSLSLVAFFWFVKTTEILQDISAPLRPDGQSPYSLARVQMATWFFLVVAAWFLLFLVTKDIDTLTSSVLVLMGISATTAVGSTIIDAGTAIDPAERVRNVPADRETLGQRIKELRDSLATTRNRVTTTDAERVAAQAEITRLTAEVSLAQSQQTFFQRRPWLRVIYDLLGDDGHISFHRFQIAVWTLVLALVFVLRLLSELGMPEFSATVLGLMGISSGTYLGFKLPAAAAAGTQAKT